MEKEHTIKCPKCNHSIDYICHAEDPTASLMCPECGCYFRVNCNLDEPIQLIDPETGDITLFSWKKDMVSHPPHYQSKKGIEVIDVIEAYTETLTGIEAADTANVIKYICRWKHKNGLEDLEKAQWYLNHLIKHVKGE